MPILAPLRRCFSLSFFFLLWSSLLFAESINPDGSFSYSIPIEIPPGTNEMQPQLALSYSSSGGNGVAGVGWNIQGLPVITRMNNGRGIRYNGQDTYASQDGRLIDTSGINSEYHTEYETGNRYVPQGFCGDGPCQWLVHEASGNKLYFGATTDSRIEALGKNGSVRVWALNKVEDPYGNYYTISYLEDTTQGDFYPYVVTYTQGNGLTHFHTVEFAYEGRNDHFDQYSQNVLVRNDRRLQWVIVRTEGHLVRRYDLRYGYSPSTQRSRLERILHYGADDTTERPPIEFSYRNNPSFAFTYHSGTSFIPTGNHDNVFRDIHMRAQIGDFNGDGLTDIMNVHPANDPVNSWIGLSNGDGSFHYTSGAAFIPQGGHNNVFRDGSIRIQTGDFNGDGFTDIMNIHPANDPVTSWIGLSNGDGTFDYRSGTDFIHRGDLNNVFRDGSIRIQTGDFNGDGLTDIMNLHPDNNAEKSWIGLSNGDGTFTFRSGTAFIPQGAEHNVFRNATSRFITGDFNGDGLTDIANVHGAAQSHSSWIGLSNGDGTFDYRSHTNFIPEGSPGHVFRDSHSRFYVGDFNGDGMSDIVNLHPDNGAQYSWIALSKGDGTFTFRSSTDFIPEGDLGYVHRHADGRFLIGDFNGDGLSDMMNLHVTSDSQYSWIGISKGDGTFTYTSNTNFIQTGLLNNVQRERDSRFFVGDWNGDGVSGIMNLFPASNSGHSWVGLNTHQLDDLVRTVSEGTGSVLEIEYKPAPQTPNAIQPTLASCGGGTEIGYGKPCGISNTAPRYLVTRTQQHDGRGNRLFKSFDYRNGRSYPGTAVERADLGFGQIVIEDEQTLAYQSTKYYQIAPFHQRPLEITNYSQVPNESGGFDSVPNKQESFQYALSETPEGIKTITMPFKEKQLYEEGELAYTYTTNKSFDVYGYDTERTECANGDCLVSTITYQHDVAAWRFGQMQSVRQEHHNNITKWERFTYQGPSLIEKESFLCGNATNCTNSEGEWISSVQNSEYDAHGNLIYSEDAAGHGIHMTYDERFQAFVKTITNPKGHQVNNTFDSFGRVIETTYANGHSKSFVYDVFGRKIQENNAKGAWIKIAYYNEGDGDTQYIQRTFLEENRLTWEKVFYDGLGYQYMTERLGDGGKVIRKNKDKRYENSLLVTLESRPYFEGDPIYWNRTDYNVYGKKSKVTLVDGTTTEFFYGPDWQEVLDANGRTRSYYDARGNLVKKVDPLGNEMVYAFNALNKPISVSFPNGQSTTWTYDSWGRKTSMSDAATGGAQYEYNLTGKLSRQTDALGNSTTFEYDELNRLTLKSSSSGETTRYTYDDPELRNNIGYLSRAESSEVTTEFSYDELGNQVGMAKTFSSLPGSFVSTFEYDFRNRLTRKTLPDSTTQEYIYSEAGNLRQVRVNGIPVATYSGHSASGKVSQKVINTSSWNEEYEVSTQYTYDQRELLQSLRTEGPDQSMLQDIHYTFDAIGNITEIVDGRESTLINDVETTTSQSFAYDALNRLTEAQGSYGTKSYSYSPMGDLQQIGGVVDRNLTYNEKNQAISGEGFSASYDAAGNMITKELDSKEWRYHYGDEGRLARIEAYRTDPTDQRYWIEAEDAHRIKPPFVTDSDSSLVGSEYVYAPLGEGNFYNGHEVNFHEIAMAEYHFDVEEAGDFAIWAKTHSPSRSQNSFYIQVDSLPLFAWHIPINREWDWSYLKRLRDPADPITTFHLEAGSHRIRFFHREDGTKLDKLLVTNNLDLVPGGIQPRSEQSSQLTSFIELRYDHNGQRIQKTWFSPNGNYIQTHYLGSNYEIRTSSEQAGVYKITRHIDAGQMGKVASITTLESELHHPSFLGMLHHRPEAYAGMMTPGIPAFLASMKGKFQSFNYHFQKHTHRPGFAQMALNTVLLITLLGLLIVIAVNRWRHRGQVIPSRFNAWQRTIAVPALMVMFWVQGCVPGAGGGSSEESSSKTSLSQPKPESSASNALQLDTYSFSDEAQENAALPFPSEALHSESLAPDNEHSVLVGLHQEGELPYYGNMQRLEASPENAMGGPLPGTWFYHQDHLGSSTVMTDAHGEEATRIRYMPFGEVDDEHSTGTQTITHTFTGQEFDAESGLMYLNGRHYDPSIGRFLTPDMFVPEEGRNLQAFNRYSYAENNPVNYTDPTGHFSFKKFLKKILPIVVSIVAGVLAVAFIVPALGLAAGGLGSAIVAGATSGFGGAFTGALVNGGSISDALEAGLKGGAMGALTGAVMHGAGKLLEKTLGKWSGYSSDKVELYRVVEKKWKIGS